jgi:molybdopterin-guanine dinucleotide biosynthesis protein A
VTPTVPDRIPVVLLAGGESRRFHGDKLRALLDGKTVLARVVDELSSLASEIIVTATSVRRATELLPDRRTNLRVLCDRPGRWGRGPAGAIASAREQLGDGPVLFVPGDVPWIEATALRRLAAKGDRSGAEIAVPVWDGGETEHLIQWQRGISLLSCLPWAPRTGVPASWRASEFLRAVPQTLLVPVAALSSRPDTFSHVTVPDDLKSPPARGRAGSTKSIRVLDGAPKMFYRTGQAERRRGNAARAAQAFAAESHWYARAGLSLLARHARDDALDPLGLSRPTTTRPYRWAKGAENSLLDRTLLTADLN